MAVLLGVIFIGVTLVARAYDIVPSVSLSGGPTVIALVAQTAFGDRQPAVLPVPDRDGADPVPGREHELQRVPAPRRDPRRGRLLPAPVRASAATGSRSAGGSSSWPAIAAALSSCSAGNTTSLIPLYSVGVFVCFTLSPGRHGPPLAPRPGPPAGGGGWPINAFGAVLTSSSSRIVVTREVLRRRLRGRDPDPAARRDDAVHPPPVRARRRASSRSATYVVAAADTARSARSSRSPSSTAPPSRRSTSPARSPTQVTAVFITDDPEAAAELRERWERQVPGVPLVVVESPYRALVGPARGLPRRPRPRLAAGQAGADHVRRPARVRRPQLVGADPLQPVRATPAQRAARATAHGRRRTCPYRRDDADRLKHGGPDQGIDVAVGDDEVHDEADDAAAADRDRA